MNDNPILICNYVNKSYIDGQLVVDVLKDLNFTLLSGQSLSVVGTSGSGKSTLLHLLGGLDTPTSGSISLMGHNLSELNQTELGKLRNQHLGFVYQFHHLLPEFTALENVMMPLLIGKIPVAQAKERALAMLDKVGLKSRAAHRSGELSGGERQRTAIARALVNNPSCLLADEPTGNLDRMNAANIIDIMLSLKEELGTALIVVTHDEELAQRFDDTLTIKDGCIHTL